MSLSPEQQEQLSPYVSNTQGKVFAITNLAGMVGAVMARYSRAPTGLRETLLREFVQEDKLDLKKAGQLIDRVLIAYGDDSVGELEGAHVSFEDISMLATKVIEHRRIGGSPIEQSTRYIRYDFRDDQGKFRYFIPEIEDQEVKLAYIKSMDRCFEIYGDCWEPLQNYLKRRKPMAEAAYDIRGRGEETLADLSEEKDRKALERTYKMDIKTKTCDVLRGFLPLASLANVGLFGNGRFFQHLISKLWTSDLHEANQLGSQTHEELSKVIPHYVKRARPSEYSQKNHQAMQELVSKEFQGLEKGKKTFRIDPDFELIARMLADGATREDASLAYNREMDISFLSSLVYPYARGHFQAIRNRIVQGGQELEAKIWNAYYGDRKTRRDRPERGIEHGYPHQFDMLTEWAVYKDLMRHRMGTIQYQPLVPDLGFEMPEEMREAGLQDQANEMIKVMEDLYAYLGQHQPKLKEYAFLQGHKMRWFIGMNDRALMHMLELRTTVQGHPNYRKASQDIHKLLAERFPQRAEMMSFVNHDDVFWSRGDSEARQRQKEAILDRKP